MISAEDLVRFVGCDEPGEVADGVSAAAAAQGA